jgi:hypothetical protein
MSCIDFRLQPFAGEIFRDDRASLALEITGKIARRDNSSLCLDFLVAGDVAEIDIPAPAGLPMRKKSLWEQTCFEMFVSEKGSSEYREFNMSPSGHWNVYRFSAYREGMREETGFESLPFSTSRADGFFTLSLEIEPARIIEADRRLVVGVGAVIRGKDGGKSFWGLKHCGSKPDFHKRGSFVIEV